ncbi:MAG: ATP-binding protein [Thaumarchaeota archaeon]|nr:ATP-binding protein [Nitrososphaerota archaeon]
MASRRDDTDETVRRVCQMVLNEYWVCITCGSMTKMLRGLCDYCQSPLPNFLHSPEPNQVRDGILLGTMSDGNPFHLPLSQFGFHFAFYGATGGGKTREAMNLAIKAENNGIKLLILDVEGEWKNILPRLQHKTEYYSTDTNLKINPYDLNDYGLVRALLKEIIFRGIEVEYQDLSPQMNYVLDQCIRESTSIPTLIDNVTNYEEHNLPFRLNSLDKTKTALLVRLEPYRSNPALSEIFYTETSSFNLEKFDDRNVLIDLHPLEAKVAYGTELRLIYNTIAVAYLKQALHREPTERISNLFIADEAQLLAPKILRKLLVTDTWATTEFAARLRKRGQSLAVVTQRPSNLEPDIVANCQNVFTFKLQDAKDIDLIARSFGFNSYVSVDHFAQELTSLKQRQAIVKTQGLEPFIMTSQNMFLSQLSAQELERYTPKVKFEMPPSIDAPRHLDDNEERLFLESISKEPFIPTRERRHLLGWDDRRYSRVVNGLSRRGEVEAVKVKLGKGKPRILYQKKGANPGIKHEFYVHWISEQLRNKGIECITSRVGPDIQTTRTAINVETGNSDILGNIWIALNDFSKVIVCSDDEELVKNVSREHGSPRVLCCLCWEAPGLCS